MLPVSLMGLTESELTALASEGVPIGRNQMGDEKFMGMVRHVMTALGAVAVYYGMTDEATWVMVGGALTTMVGFLWSYMSKA